MKILSIEQNCKTIFEPLKAERAIIRKGHSEDNAKEICLFPLLILDKVCMLDLFQTRITKSVPDHIDYYLRRIPPILAHFDQRECVLSLCQSG